ncbi:AGE family epimerase/isomerase [Sphingomonas sp. CV7422]|uniref:AGE family epimerase/isomerase n=1 Tax=Sphingomonas sp. CV7422 TaxID=3018036 RepID=UPI0022FEF95D|nr:AGE family epimerase/isomerase [Sphingomonas sp. CV7422]
MTPVSLRIRKWLTDVCLPLWASIGVDGEQGGFVERLTLAGLPDLTAPKRVRVQARQIYVFSHAKLLGLMPDGDVVARTGYDFVVAHGFPDGIKHGVVHALARDGAVLDPKRDTYDHAFLLFALSWYYRATGERDVLTKIIQLGDTISATLRHPNRNGFVVDSNNLTEFHQNPHMHLFEAVLAAYDATGQSVFLDRAREIFDIFLTGMFDHTAGVLREFYDTGWRPAAGAAGDYVEPGHHCEWIWLLRWYADRMGEPLCDAARRLYDFVERHGRPAGILLCDEVWIDGRVKKASTRCWPQTEAIKAELALAGSAVPVPTAVSRIAAITDAVFATFLDRPVIGAWTDWVDAAGRPMVQSIPASSLYHLFLAFSEVLERSPT